MERAEWSTAGGEGLDFTYAEFGMGKASSIRATLSGIARGVGVELGQKRQCWGRGDSPGWTRKRGSEKRPCGMS